MPHSLVMSREAFTAVKQLLRLEWGKLSPPSQEHTGTAPKTAGSSQYCASKHVRRELRTMVLCATCGGRAGVQASVCTVLCWARCTALQSNLPGSVDKNIVACIISSDVNSASVRDLDITAVLHVRAVLPEM